MKPVATIRQWAALAGCAALLAAVLVLHARGGLAQLGQDSELGQLRDERRRLAGCDDAAVRAGRAAVEQLRRRQPSARPPAGWTVEPVPAGNGQPARVRLRRTVPTGWADLVQTIESESARAGARLVSLDITSSGSRQVRAIAAVEILLEHPTETPSRPNPPGGTVFPGADGPATTPAVGPAPSGQPLVGPPSRPDPRGPRGRNGSPP
jgi:hypothetical protein